jgi:hypothetical protein
VRAVPPRPGVDGERMIDKILAIACAVVLVALFLVPV